MGWPDSYYRRRSVSAPQTLVQLEWNGLEWSANHDSSDSLGLFDGARFDLIHQGSVCKTARNLLLRRTILLGVMVLAALAAPVRAQIRQREPNSEYAARRARLRAQVDAPIVFFGYTGKESASEAYVFNQENNFYYLTGHNEEGAALLLVPDSSPQKVGRREGNILSAAAQSLQVKRWNGPRIGPDDPGVQEKTGFAESSDSQFARDDLQKLAEKYPTFYTLMPMQMTPDIRTCRTGWRGSEKRFRRESRANRVANRRAPPDQIRRRNRAAHPRHRTLRRRAARRHAHHSSGTDGISGCRAHGRNSSGGRLRNRSVLAHRRRGINSTVLHLRQVGAQIEDGDIVVIDVGGQYSGYTADITRTLPANGKFTARQREIYDIVYGAQQAALAAVKPGATLGRSGPTACIKSPTITSTRTAKICTASRSANISFTDWATISAWKCTTRETRTVPLEPGMVVTIEPGIYIPEEKIGVRIEDDVLITPTGYKLLTARLPRKAEEIEKIMAEAKAQRAAAVQSEGIR